MAVLSNSLRATLVKMLQGMCVDGLVQLAGGNPANPPYSNTQAQNEVSYLSGIRSVTFQVTDGGTAATAVSELGVLTVDPGLSNGIQVLYAEYNIQTATTANNSNYATFTLAQRTGGGAATTITSNTTQITDPVMGANTIALASYQGTAPATAAAASVTSTGTTAATQSALTFKIGKTGTGVALGVVTVTVFYKET